MVRDEVAGGEDEHYGKKDEVGRGHELSTEKEK